MRVHTENYKILIQVRFSRISRPFEGAGATQPREALTTTRSEHRIQGIVRFGHFAGLTGLLDP
jgi:hypothetical protein